MLEQLGILGVKVSLAIRCSAGGIICRIQKTLLRLCGQMKYLTGNIPIHSMRMYKYYVYVIV